MGAMFEGGVFSASIEGGRAGARVIVRHDALVAVTSEGHELSVPYPECELELGGASGRMWFCRARDRATTIFCEDPGFPSALRDAAGHSLGAALDRLEIAARGEARRSVLYWAIGLALASLVALAGYYGLRQLGRASVQVLPISVDEKIGELALDNMSFEGTPIHDELIDRALKTMVDRLSRGMPTRFKFTVRVVEAPIVNAYALPGGPIVVYTGLLREAKTPEEVAGVLAHEMAHVTERHGMQRIAQSLGVVAAVQLLFGDVSGVAAVAVQMLSEGAINGYSREQEHEADMKGAKRLKAAHVDPRALADFFVRLEQREGGYVPRAVSWLGTHPELGQRIKDVRAEAKRLGDAHPEPFSSIRWSDVQQHAGAVVSPESAP